MGTRSTVISILLMILTAFLLLQFCGCGQSGSSTSAYYSSSGTKAVPDIKDIDNMNNPGQPLRSGDWCEIKGQNFGGERSFSPGSSYVDFAGSSQSSQADLYYTWSDSRITCRVPSDVAKAGAIVKGIMRVTVTLSNGTTSAPYLIASNPTPNPYPQPTPPGPSPSPTATPSSSPAASPSLSPSVSPTASPSASPTVSPTSSPSPSVSPSPGTDWKTVGGGPLSSQQGYFPSLCVSDGTVYVAFSDGASGQKAVAWKCSGSSWEQIGGALSDDVAQNIDIAVCNSVPYVIYSDSRSGNCIVKRYKGGAWEQVSTKLTSGVSTYNQIAIDPSMEIVYAAYTDSSQGGMAYISIYDDQNADWFQLATAVSTGEASFLSLSVFYGVPALAYRDAEDQKAHVKIYGGDEWIEVGTASSAGSPGSISLLIPEWCEDIIPYMACTDGGMGGKAVVRMWNECIAEGEWVSVGNPPSSGSADYVCFALSDTAPCCVYSDSTLSGRARAQIFDGSWNNLGTAGFSTGAASNLSFQIYEGVPYCAYRDAGQNNRIVVKKYQ